MGRLLRAETGMKSVKRIALSGYGTETDQTRSTEAGLYRRLIKPVDPNALPDIISAVNLG